MTQHVNMTCSVDLGFKKCSMSTEPPAQGGGTVVVDACAYVLICSALTCHCDCSFKGSVRSHIGEVYSSCTLELQSSREQQTQSKYCSRER